MEKLAYYRESIDCPECGLPTNYLQEVTETYITGKGEIDQTKLMCVGCFETEEE